MVPAMHPPEDIPTAFSGMPLDRADGLRQKPDWIAAQLADPAARFLPLADLKPGLRPDGDLVWHSRAEAQPALQGGAMAVFLGLDKDRTAHFAYQAEAGPLPDGADWIDMRMAAMRLAADGAAVPGLAIAGLGRAMIDWHRRHLYCAVCGSNTEMIRGGYARRCSACGAEHFPRVDPVVIMLVVRGDYCLLGRQARFPPGMVSALAGFVEPGETIEEAVRREVMEEASVQVGWVRYLCSQPWPFPSSLMLGCLAEGLSEAITPDPNEIEAADWYSKDEVQAALAGAVGRFRPPIPAAIACRLLEIWSRS